jgi:hypothetical protein
MCDSGCEIHFGRAVLLYRPDETVEPRKSLELLAIATRLAGERQKASHDLLLEIRRWKGRSFSRKWRSRLELSA